MKKIIKKYTLMTYAIVILLPLYSFFVVLRNMFISLARETDNHFLSIVHRVHEDSSIRES